jgi:hypothetical protein
MAANPAGQMTEIKAYRIQSAPIVCDPVVTGNCKRRENGQQARADSQPHDDSPASRNRSGASASVSRSPAMLTRLFERRSESRIGTQ